VRLLHKLGLSQEKGEDSSEKKDELDEYASNLETNCQTKDINAKNHYYTVDIVMISIQLLIKCGTSFRGEHPSFYFLGKDKLNMRS
jgi:hypothetical protein